MLFDSLYKAFGFCSNLMQAMEIVFSGGSCKWEIVSKVLLHVFGWDALSFTPEFHNCSQEMTYPPTSFLELHHFANNKTISFLSMLFHRSPAFSVSLNRAYL